MRLSAKIGINLAKLFRWLVCFFEPTNRCYWMFSGYSEVGWRGIKKQSSKRTQNTDCWQFCRRSSVLIGNLKKVLLNERDLLTSRNVRQQYKCGRTVPVPLNLFTNFECDTEVDQEDRSNVLYLVRKVPVLVPVPINPGGHTEKHVLLVLYRFVMNAKFFIFQRAMVTVALLLELQCLIISR